MSTRYEPLYAAHIVIIGVQMLMGIMSDRQLRPEGLVDKTLLVTDEEWGIELSRMDDIGRHTEGCNAEMARVWTVSPGR